MRKFKKKLKCSLKGILDKPMEKTIVQNSYSSEIPKVHMKKSKLLTNSVMTFIECD